MRRKMKFYEWLDYWREMYYCPSVSPGTYTINEYYIRIIRNHFENQKLTEITALDCQKLLNLLYSEGYARSSIKKCITILNKAFAKAMDERVIDQNPMIGHTVPKAPTKKVNALKQKQQVALEVYCQDTLYGDFMLFLLYTGLRIGEMIALQWKDFDPVERIICIRKSKTESGIRELPLVQKAYDIICAQKKSEQDDFIFRNIHDRPISYSSMKKCYEKLRIKTGFEDFTNHVCRHSFATRLTERGANPKSVAGLLGHKKVEYAMNIYTDVERETLKKEIFLLDGQRRRVLTPTEKILLACLKYISQQCGGIPVEIERLIAETDLEI